MTVTPQSRLAEDRLLRVAEVKDVEEGRCQLKRQSLVLSEEDHFASATKCGTRRHMTAHDVFAANSSIRTGADSNSVVKAYIVNPEESSYFYNSTM
jgi:hypothetical protein